MTRPKTIEPPPCKVTEAIIAEFATLSPHTLCKVASGLKCTKREGYSPKSDLKERLGTQCPSIITIAGIVSIGNREIHHTQLSVSKGVLWCGRCGAYSVNRVALLGQPCKPPTVAGRRNKLRLSNGIPPQGVRPYLALPMTVMAGRSPGVHALGYDTPLRSRPASWFGFALLPSGLALLSQGPLQWEGNQALPWFL